MNIDIPVEITTGLTFFEIGEVESTDIGDSVFSFIEKMARKEQVLATTDRAGNLVYQRASGVKDKQLLVNQTGNDHNNILSAKFTSNTSKLFNKYQVHSQAALISINEAGFVGAEQVSSSGSPPYFDEDVRTGREKHILSETAYADKTSYARAAWNRNVAYAQAFRYQCTVEGHSKDDGGVWELNRLHKVNDDFAGVNDFWLLNSVSVSMSLSEGNTTDLGFVPKESYALTIQDIDDIQGIEDRGRLEYWGYEPTGAWTRTPFTL